jgi:hypothetical protein
MSPTQRDVLRLLSVQKEGLYLHDIANRLSQDEKRIYAPSIIGAFSRNREWVASDTGRLNDRSLITISPEGRAALVAYDEHREATHPMGSRQPGRFFVFVEEVQVIKRHTMIVRDVADEAEAEAVARAQCDEGMYPQVMSISIDRTYKVRPMREGHGR